jgi:predicted HNH restriction endonuclease
MIKINKNGFRPQNGITNTEKALLISAWAYGLKPFEHIHRLSLFAFVQSHLANSTEENLQGFIEKDFPNWKALGKGLYELTQVGFNKTLEFGTQNTILPRELVYSFKRSIENYSVTVEVDSIIKKYSVQDSELNHKADKIIQNIKMKTGDHIPTSQTSKPRKVFNWILSGNKYEWNILTSFEPSFTTGQMNDFKELDEEEKFPEGKEKFRIHKLKERNQKLIALKKQKAFLNNENLPCEICGFSFKSKYGDIGENFIEAHHIIPISQLSEQGESTLDDLILVCSNCHRMIHKKRPWLNIDEIMELIQ